MALIEVVNDIHATERPPSSCTETYWPDLLDLLRQSADVARDRGADAVVWAGDVFHHKAPGRTPHKVVQDLIGVAQSYPCPLYVVPGNHDLHHDRLDSIDVTQPLGVLLRAGARRLEGWADDGLPLYGVPWQQRWSREAVLRATDDFRLRAVEPSLVVTHAPLYPPGREPRYEGAELTPAPWWTSALGAADRPHGLAYGHIHEPHGTWQAGTSLLFCNDGALSRGSLDEYNLSRQVGVSLWNSGPLSFEFVPLDAKPPEEVFRLRERKEVVTARRSLAGFVDGVEAVSLGLLTAESVLAHVRRLGLGPDVVNLTEELLAAQQGGS